MDWKRLGPEMGTFLVGSNNRQEVSGIKFSRCSVHLRSVESRALCPAPHFTDLRETFMLVSC